MHRILLLLFVFGAFAAIGEERGEANLRIFNDVYRAIAEKHYDRNFIEQNRDAFEKAKPAILAAPDDTTLARAITRFLASLPDSHLALSAPVDKNAPIAPSGSTAAESGLTFFETGGKLLVASVRPNSAGARAGVRPGDQLLAIDQADFSGNSDRIGWAIHAGQMLSSGEKNRDKLLKILRNGKTLNLKIKTVPPKNPPPLFQLGEMPPIAQEYHSQLLQPEAIALIRFNAFTPQAIINVRQDVTGKFKDARGLILDLRNNIGGLILLASDLSGWITPKPVPMGQMTVADTTLTPESYPQRNGFKKPLAILIDRNSYSTAEVFAAAMQDAQTAVIIGEPSAGMCLPSTFIELPNGFRLQTIVGNYRRPNGGSIEFLGVTPDLVAPNTSQSLEKSQDNALETAKKVLLEKR